MNDSNNVFDSDSVVGNLPFEFCNEKDKKVFESPTECLLWAYTCTEVGGMLSDGLSWIDDGLKQWPDHPDLLAFIVLYRLKNYLAYKDDYDSDYNGYNPIAEKLLAMDREDFTVRAYVACLIYMVFTKPEDAEVRCRQLTDEMQVKFKYDVCVILAEYLLRQRFGEGLTDLYIEELRTMYNGLYEFQIIDDDNFSDYVTSRLPLIEMIIDEFQWPDKEHVKTQMERLRIIRESYSDFVGRFCSDDEEDENEEL